MAGAKRGREASKGEYTLGEGGGVLFGTGLRERRTETTGKGRLDNSDRAGRRVLLGPFDARGSRCGGQCSMQSFRWWSIDSLNAERRRQAA